MKKVVITGATKGIGKAIATKLANTQRYHIAICGRNQNELHHLAAKLQEHSPNIKVHAHQCDLTEADQVESWTVKLLKNDFIPEILINNAGLFIQSRMTEEADATLELLMQTNLYAPYQLTKNLVPDMKDQRKGHIVNIGSTASLQGYADSGSYCISKHALLGFSRSLREELKPFNIRVSTVMPGATLTNSWDGTSLPDDRFIPPEDIASAVLMSIETSTSTNVDDIVIRPAQGDI